jgi:maleate cis-trans isomerase
MSNAWRARIGLVSPTARGRGFAFWYKNAPDGVEIIPTYIGFRTSTPETFGAGFQRAEELATELRSYDCTLIVVSGTPPFLLKGPEWEREWGDRLSQKLGVPVITGMAPDAVALQAMGVRSAAIATYYGEELNQAIASYFAYYGIRGHIMGGYSDGTGGDVLYTTSLSALNNVTHQDVYHYCKEGWENLPEPVDALYLNGGGWDATPAIDFLERDLETKVMFSQSAQMWQVYKTLKIENRVEGCGSLLSDDYRLTKLVPVAAAR